MQTTNGRPTNNEGGIPNPRCAAVLGASADHGARPRLTPQNPSQKLMAQWRSHTPHATCPRALAAPNSTKHPSEQRTSDFSEQRRSGLASSYAEWRSGEAHTSTLATQNPVTRRCAKRTPASTTGLKPTDCNRPGQRRPRSAAPTSGGVDAPIGGVVTARHTTGPRTEPRESCPERARVRSGDTPTSDETRRMVDVQQRRSPWGDLREGS